MSDESIHPGYVTYADEYGVVSVRFAGAPGQLVVRALEFDHAASADWLRSVPVGQLTAWANGLQAEQLHQILTGGGEIAFDASHPVFTGERLNLGTEDYPRSKPDAFYRQVALIHTMLRAEGSRRPALELAEANDVPVSTVHRWMKEARRRGVMPGTEEA